MQKTISDYLLSLGFIPNKCGYRYVFDLIYLATSGKEILPLKYVGYAEIAKKYKKPSIPLKKTCRTQYPPRGLKVTSTRFTTNSAKP